MTTRWRQPGAHSFAICPDPSQHTSRHSPSARPYRPRPGRPLAFPYIPHEGATMSRLFVVAAVLGLVACTDRDDVSAPEADPAPVSRRDRTRALRVSRASGGAHTALSGGATTVFDVSPDAFSFAAPNLAGITSRVHEEGDEDFEDAFVPAPRRPSTPDSGPCSTTCRARRATWATAAAVHRCRASRSLRSCSGRASSGKDRTAARRRARLRRPAPAPRGSRTSSPR